MTPEQYNKGIEDIKSLARGGSRQEIERVLLKLWESSYGDWVRLKALARDVGMKET